MGRILIIEDEPNTREMLVKITKEVDSNATIYQTGSVKKAMEIIINEHIDILLIDIQLEDGDGLELAKEIRTLYRYKRTAMLFITAIPTHAILAYDETHCYKYITKPFPSEKLKEVLTELIDHDYKKNENVIFNVKYDDFTYCVNSKDIVYLEIKNRDLVFHLEYGDVIQHRGSIKDAIDVLPKKFMQCHRAYVINTERVAAINKSNYYLMLKGKEVIIPIGRKYYKNLLGCI